MLTVIIHWLKPILALVTGATVWEGFKFFYPSLTQRLKNYREGRKTFFSGLDPILKAADELYGKIYSLAKEDFTTFINPAHAYAEDIEHNKKYVIYLFAQFWAQLEYIRIKSQYTSLVEFKRGRQLFNFIETIESRQYRLLDRSIQRVIGETLIEGATPVFKIMNLNQFIRNYEDTSSEIHKWGEKLEAKLNATNETEIRQRFLVFGVIVAALIDHLDPDHRIIHPNQIYKNKLNTASKNLMRRNLFQHFLKFVKNKEKYY